MSLNDGVGILPYLISRLGHPIYGHGMELIRSIGGQSTLVVQVLKNLPRQGPQPRLPIAMLLLWTMKIQGRQTSQTPPSP